MRQILRDDPDPQSLSSDLSEDEWAPVAPHLTLARADAGRREYPLREVFDGLRYV